MTGVFLNGKWQTIYGIHTWIRHGNSYWCRTSRPSTGCCMSAVAKSLLRCQPFLVGGLNPSEKYYSIGMIIPNICKKKSSKPPTRFCCPVTRCSGGTSWQPSAWREEHRHGGISRFCLCWRRSENRDLNRLVWIYIC